MAAAGARTLMRRALALLALAGAWWPAGADELRLAVAHGPVSLPVYVAEAQGHFAAEGVTVKFLDCASGRQCFERLAQGQADLATAAELLVTLDRFRGGEHVIVATLSQSARQIKLVARAAGGTLAPEQLRGRRIATVAGTSAQYFLDAWLLYHGLDPRGIEPVALPPDRLVGALQRREVDAVVIWEPIASAARAALGAEAAALPSPRVYTQHFSLVANRRLVAEREPALLALLRALARSQRFIAERPAEARRILQQRLGIDAALAAAAAAEHDFRLQLDQSLITTMDGQARWALREGLVAASRPPATLLQAVEAGPLRKAAPGAVKLLQ